MADTKVLLPVWDTIVEAWHQVKGAKGSIWAAFGMVILISFLLGICAGIFDVIAPGLKIGTVIQVIAQIIAILMSFGLLYIGIQRGTGNPIRWRMVFYTFDFEMIVKIIGLYVLMLLILIIPMCILMFASFLFSMAISNIAKLSLVLLFAVVIAGLIFLFVRLGLSMAFILGQRKGPWEAIQLSYRATYGNVWRIIGLYLLLLVIYIISAIPLLIGLIWTYPLAVIVYGVLYKTLKVNVES